MTCKKCSSPLQPLPPALNEAAFSFPASAELDLLNGSAGTRLLVDWREVISPLADEEGKMSPFLVWSFLQKEKPFSGTEIIQMILGLEEFFAYPFDDPDLRCVLSLLSLFVKEADVKTITQMTKIVESKTSFKARYLMLRVLSNLVDKQTLQRLLLTLIKNKKSSVDEPFPSEEIADFFIIDLSDALTKAEKTKFIDALLTIGCEKQKQDEIVACVRDIFLLADFLPDWQDLSLKSQAFFREQLCLEGEEFMDIYKLMNRMSVTIIDRKLLAYNKGLYSRAIYQYLKQGGSLAELGWTGREVKALLMTTPTEFWQNDLEGQETFQKIKTELYLPQNKEKLQYLRRTMLNFEPENISAYYFKEFYVDVPDPQESMQLIQSVMKTNDTTASGEALSFLQAVLDPQKYWKQHENNYPQHFYYTSPSYAARYQSFLVLFPELRKFLGEHWQQKTTASPDSIGLLAIAGLTDDLNFWSLAHKRKIIDRKEQNLISCIYHSPVAVRTYLQKLKQNLSSSENFLIYELMNLDLARDVFSKVYYQKNRNLFPLPEQNAELFQLIVDRQKEFLNSSESSNLLPLIADAKQIYPLLQNYEAQSVDDKKTGGSGRNCFNHLVDSLVLARKRHLRLREE